jgi:hypothetical protein
MVLPKYLPLLKAKQGGSKQRARQAWLDATLKVRNIIKKYPSKIQRLYLLAGIYWGEGTKAELNLINSDPGLIKTYVRCLTDLGIKKDDLRITLRIHKELDPAAAIRFWSSLLAVNPNKISGMEIIDGQKQGKLRYGMCRVRVTNSAPYFKLIVSLINVIKEQFDAAVVQRIEQGTPKP